MKVLCVFGKHQYGDASRGLSTEYRVFVPALERNGHEVVLFDSWDRAACRDLAALNRNLLETVERERPAILLLVPMVAEVWLETLQIIRARGDVATICWTTDDSWKYEQQSKYIGSAFHVITTTYPHIVDRYRRDGIPQVVLTQWAASSEDLRTPRPASECKYDVTFVGAMHGNRQKRVEELARLGVVVECFGYGWPRGSVSAAEMLEVIGESRISLNFANSQGDNQIKARVFEVPGAGGFLLTEDAPGLDRYYAIGSEIDSFRDMPELARKVQHYLAHPELRDAMCVRAYERTKGEHTYDIRLRDIIEAALEQKRADAPLVNVPSFDDAVAAHRLGTLHRAARAMLVAAATILFGRRRARRAARRLLYELSWRLAGRRTYTAAGLPGRMFPAD